MDLQQKLARLFTLTFALLMGLGAHYFQHNQGGSGLELAQNNVVWVFFSILIGLGLWTISVQKKITYTRFTLIFLSALLLFSVPLFYPNNGLASQSYSRLLALAAGFLLFVSLQQFQFSRKQLLRLLLLVVLAGFLQACYSLMQDYLLSADNIFGYNVGYGRPYGIFQQPNVLASFMATSLILAGYLLLQINDRRLQTFLLVTALLNMWVITITMSRTGYLGTLIALLLFIPWAWQSNKKKLAVFIITILCGIGLAMIKGEGTLGVRSADNLKEAGQRQYLYEHSWQMIKDKPLMGYGYGGFEKNYLITSAKRVKSGELPPRASDLTHPHNEILFWAVEGGVVPIVAMLLLVFSFLLLLRSFKLPKALALIALVIPISIHTQTEYPLYHSTLHWLVLLILVFFISNQSEKLQNKRFTPTFAIRSFALLIPILTCIFMISNLNTISKITRYERSKQPDINVILNIINPVVFEDRFNFHLNYFRLSMALRLNKQDEVKKVIEWTESIIETRPKSFFYIILYAAYINNNQVEEAKQVLDYARYLYPLDQQLVNAEATFNKAKPDVSTALQTSD